MTADEPKEMSHKEATQSASDLLMALSVGVHDTAFKEALRLQEHIDAGGQWPDVESADVLNTLIRTVLGVEWRKETKLKMAASSYLFGYNAGYKGQSVTVAKEDAEADYDYDIMHLKAGWADGTWDHQSDNDYKTSYEPPTQ